MAAGSHLLSRANGHTASNNDRPVRVCTAHAVRYSPLESVAETFRSIALQWRIHVIHVEVFDVALQKQRHGPREKYVRQHVGRCARVRRHFATRWLHDAVVLFDLRRVLFVFQTQSRVSHWCGMQTETNTLNRYELFTVWSQIMPAHSSGWRISSQ